MSRPRLPSLRALRAFDAVARLGGVSQAAADLQVSAGAVSQQIRLLELHVGAQLIERAGRGVVLTRLGRAYHGTIGVAFEALLAAQDAIECSRKATDITISALPSLISTWLIPCLVRFRNQHGTAALHLVGGEDEPDIADDKVDFRISYGHRVRKYPRFTELFVDSVVPVCAPTLARTAGLRTPRDLLRLPLIRLEWERDFTPAPSWEEWFRSVGLALDRAPPGLSFSMSSAAIAAAVEGDGLALAQRSMIEAELAAGRLMVPFDKPLLLPEAYFVAWDAGALTKTHGQLLLPWLVETGRALGAAGR